ncbi:MAG: T9SS type A sorting domain-containing protein [Flavobacterium sp.]
MKISTLLFFAFLIGQQSFAEINHKSGKLMPALDLLINSNNDLPNIVNKYRKITTSVSISYNSPFCQDASIQNVSVTGTGNYLGGIYTSMAGLYINAISGAITPSMSTPGWYVVTYTIAANGTDPIVISNAVVTINSPLALTYPTPLSLCDDGPQTPIPSTVFDLTVKNNEITQNSQGHTVGYYLSQADALAGNNVIANPTAYTNIANPQTLTVKVTTAQGCSSYTTLDIRVLPLPTPNANPATLVRCDDAISSSGTELFDLTVNEPYVGNGNPNLTFEYYTTQNDAIAQINMIGTPTAYEVGTTSTWIRVANNQVSFSGSNCFVLVQQSVVVNPFPVVNNPVHSICVTNTSGFATFTLSSINEDLLGNTQNTSDFSITYYMTPADAQAGTNSLPNSYTNITNPQSIYARVINNATGCVNFTGIVTLSVATGALASAPSPLSACDDDFTPDGIYTFDLTQLNSQVLNGQNPMLFAVAYFSTQADAVIGTNQIINADAYTTGTGTVWIVVTNVVTLCRSNVTLVSITVNSLAQPIITSTTGSNTICVEWGTNVLLSGLTLDSGITNSNYTFQWSLNGVSIAGTTSATFSAGMPGIYTVTAISTSVLACSSLPSSGFLVIQSGPAVPLVPDYTITNVSGVQNITVNVVGYGIYHYQLDNGPILDNGGVFENVSTGLHSIKVYDVKGNTSCNTLTISNIDINQTPAPLGNTNQTFNQGQTLANLIVSGSTIQWYSSPSGGIALPMNTVLVNGVTYYASQNINGHESSARLGVTVQLSLNNNEFGFDGLTYYPNPVTDILNIVCNEKIKTVTVYNTLGQEVYKQNSKDFNFQMQLSSLVTGSYFVKIKSDNKQNIFKIIKK